MFVVVTLLILKICGDIFFLQCIKNDNKKIRVLACLENSQTLRGKHCFSSFLASHHTQKPFPDPEQSFIMKFIPNVHEGMKKLGMDDVFLKKSHHPMLARSITVLVE